jgi:hypothetical protein
VTESEASPDLEVLDTTEAFFAYIDEIVAKNVGALERIGGNVLIHVFGVGTRTIVCSGPRKGLYREATEEDPIDYAFCVQQWVLLHLVDDQPDDDFDLGAAIEAGAAVFDGDPKPFRELMKLGQNAKNSLSIRMF